MAGSSGRKVTAFRWMTKRLLIVTVACTLAGLTIAIPADAYFTSNGSGTGSANEATLGSPAPVTVTLASPAPAGSVVVTWRGVPGPDGQPISGYFLTESNGTTVSAACGSSPKALLDAGESTGTLSCTDGGLAGGTYVYTVTAVFASWTHAASSGPVVVPATSTVTFDANGGSGTMPDETYTSGVAQALTPNAFTNGSDTFNDWCTTATCGAGSTTYTDGESITISANVILYAQWSVVVPATSTVTFDANGGSGTMPDETYTSGVAQALTPNAFTNGSDTFNDWCTTATCGAGSTTYTDGESITISANVILYAQWSASAAPTGGPPEVVIIQDAPFGAAVTTTGSTGFTDTLATNGSGATFNVTSPSTDLAVSSLGKVTTTGPLAVGTYSISGTDAETAGGSGYWGFTLSVTATSTAVGGPPIIIKVVPQVVLAAYTPWTLFVDQAVRFRVHLYGWRGTVSGVVKLEFRGQTLCTPKLTRGVGHCTVSSAKIGLGRHYLLVDYAGSGFYKPLKRRVNVFVHDTAVFP